ncbi:hypothetical protein DFH09DRAFT_1091737 [Mycena vulgaris]|nr:hypothetical protein DFH09DRAFT_1091737 [Mycena vulgaris]
MQPSANWILERLRKSHWSHHVAYLACTHEWLHPPNSDVNGWWSHWPAIFRRVEPLPNNPLIVSNGWAATSTATVKCNNLLDLTSAVELLEQGLAMTYQQILELNADFEGLPSDRAHYFSRLSEELYRGTSTDLRKVATRRKDLLENIRKQPALNTFCFPNLTPFFVMHPEEIRLSFYTAMSMFVMCILVPDPDSDPVPVRLRT